MTEHDQTVHRIAIYAARLRGTERQLYDVIDRDTGDVLIERSPDPEWEAARLLKASGAVGILETHVGDRPYPSFRLPLAVAAELTTLDGKKFASRIGQWKTLSAKEAITSSEPV